MGMKTVSTYDGMRNPFFRENSRERDAISRGAYLQEIYEDFEHDKDEITGSAEENSKKLILPFSQAGIISKPKSLDSIFMPGEIINFVLENIPLPGKIRFYGKIFPTVLGDYNERGYGLNLSSQQWNHRINRTFGFGLEKGEEAPEIKEYLSGIHNFLIKHGYTSKICLEQSALDINGYKDNYLRKEKMDKIKERKKDKIPLMREFLVANFPQAHYGEGESKNLSKKSATFVETCFNDHYNYVKRCCKSSSKE